MDVAVFTATKGLFLVGQVSPPIPDVTITLTSPQLPAPVRVITTSQGDYSLGPFPRNLDYSLQAEKPGYVITQAEGGSFSAKKLASVSVKVEAADSDSEPGAELGLGSPAKRFRPSPVQMYKVANI